MTRIIKGDDQIDRPVSFEGAGYIKTPTAGQTLRRFRRGKGWIAVLEGSTSPYAQYALALDFTKGEYWSGGVQYGASEGLNRHNFTTLGSAWQSLGDGSYAVNNTGGTASDASSNTALVGLASKRFRLTFTASNVVGLLYAYIGNTNPNLNPIVNGVNTLTVTVVSSNYIWRANPGASATISNIQLVELPGIHQLPGYSFTRTGTQGALDTDGGVDSFTVNVPAINGKGYHAYGALTNSTFKSQDIATWATLNEVTATANAVTAPDGSMTADTIAQTATSGGHYVHTSDAQSYTAGTVYTQSVFAKKGANTDFIQLTGRSGAWGTASYANFNLATGTVADVAGGSAYIVDVGNGWHRCVFVAAPITTSTSGDLVIAFNHAGTAARLPNHAGDVARTVHLWQAQTLQGNFPDGGPIIPTTSAAASIGASVLQANVNPYTVDQDFIAWGVADFNAPTDASSDVIFTFGTGSWVGRSNTGKLHCAGFGTNVSDTVTVTTGRGVVLVRRSAGKIAFFVKRPDGSVVKVAETTAPYPADATGASVHVGTYPSGTNFETRGTVRGIFSRTGTFSDAEITAILEAA